MSVAKRMLLFSTLLLPHILFSISFELVNTDLLSSQYQYRYYDAYDIDQDGLWEIVAGSQTADDLAILHLYKQVAVNSPEFALIDTAFIVDPDPQSRVLFTSHPFLILINFCFTVSPLRLSH